MDEEGVARLRQQLKEAEARAAEEQRRREDEQGRREAAERAAEDALPTTLGRYLEDCHNLWRAVRVVTDRSLTTQGDTTQPTGRIYPKRIIPWEDFAIRQQEVWRKLADSSLGSLRVFPSSHYSEQIRSELDPISSEMGLRHTARDIVEKAVHRLVQEVCQDSMLQVQLNLRGTMTFESHLPRDETIEEAMQQASVRSPSPSVDPDSGSRRGRGDRRSKASSRSGRTSRAASVRSGRKRGKGGRADQFCIYRQADGQRVPTVAIEYKAPHKLTQEMVVTGLTGEIVPDEDIIGCDDESVQFLSKWLMAAVVTQCFSYMIHQGIQDGYIFTGEAVVFLHIPEDPTLVFFHVCIPSLDVIQDNEDRLHRTAVAQVFAFILYAMASDPPPQAWHDAADKLDTWAVEYVDILGKIPETDRKPGQPPSAYKTGKWKGSVRSPIRTRARCAQGLDKTPKHDDSDDNGDSDLNQQSPTPPARLTRSQTTLAAARRDAGRSDSSASPADPDAGSRVSIKERPFCTHECLLGILRSDMLDPACPNVASHGKKHISQPQFLDLIKTQLGKDRDRNADCVPLHIEGSRGALFKVRLSSHGYTLVAKGMEEHNRKHLRHECHVYEHLSKLQGAYIPVCLGQISLLRSWNSPGRTNTRMLLFSWGGKPLFEHIEPENLSVFVEKATRALQQLHRQFVVHKDAELRNFLYDKASDKVMLIDLERATIQRREPLGELSSNRKRKRGTEKSGDDSFAREIRALKGYLSRSVR